jgi:hypothetical protein
VMMLISPDMICVHASHEAMPQALPKMAAATPHKRSLSGQACLTWHHEVVRPSNCMVERRASQKTARRKFTTPLSGET